MTDQPENEIPENEIIAAARAAKASADAARSTPEPWKNRSWELAALGAGIGSAAIAAALLFANRSRKRG
ncbi:hypothetical protein [uncultured Sphingomonas sp.]|uniref:hypothetical protein n=1 Tax=uncultured Sphingomonas sp. TaxID=158754 RepID=UPI0035CA41A3